MSKKIILYLIMFSLLVNLAIATTDQEMIDMMFDYFKLDETSGTTVTSEIDLGARNAIVGGNPDDNQWTAGILNNAFQNDGNDDWGINLDDAYDSVLDAAYDFSIEFWWYARDNDTTSIIFTKYTGDRMQMKWKEGRNGIYWWVGDELDSDQMCVGLTYDKWYHVVGTFEAGVGQKLYVNGQLCDQGSVTSITASTYSNHIGWNYDTNSKINGIIDNFIIYNDTLTGDEVNYSYNNGVGRDYFATDTTPPNINDSTWNCSSAFRSINEDAWRTDKTTEINVTDTTPTVRFDTDENANCRIRNEDLNFSSMNSTFDCSTTGETSHVCTMPIELEQNSTNIYIACEDSQGNENISSTSGALGLWVDNKKPSVGLSENSSGNVITNGTSLQWLIYAKDVSGVYNITLNENYTDTELVLNFTPEFKADEISTYHLNVTYEDLSLGDVFCVWYTAYDYFDQDINKAAECVEVVAEEAADSCSYGGSGDWEVTLEDNCSVDTSYDLGANKIIITGESGYFETAAGVTITAKERHLIPTDKDGDFIVKLDGIYIEG